jgi:hypothetical protein
MRAYTSGYSHSRSHLSKSILNDDNDRPYPVRFSDSASDLALVRAEDYYPRRELLLKR